MKSLITLILAFVISLLVTWLLQHHAIKITGILLTVFFVLILPEVFTQ